MMRNTLLSISFLLLCCTFAMPRTATAAIFSVDGSNPAAADTNPGTAAKPWKTISRAAGAAELKAGDTVLVQSGVYRDPVHITVSGAPGKPITFAAAPGAQVVIKGSKIIDGPWTRVTGDPSVKEPYPNAYSNVWKIHLDDTYFQDLPADGHFISDVFLGDGASLQEIGQDPIYTDHGSLSPIGKDLTSIYQNSFYFDKATQTLYIDLDGMPEWYCIEVGTIPLPLQVSKVHDVNIKGFEVRQNRQRGSQGGMSSVDTSQRVVISDCAFTHADFGGLGLGQCKNCTVKNCTISQNGDVGFSFYMCTDCTLDHSRLIGNNTRHFNPGWHAGGSKNIPGNTRCTIENCEVAYNIDCPGIWFDDGNADCRIIHNVVHHNGTGIFYEISPGGATIADNLVFSNNDRGIYISGSQGAVIVNNTIADNSNGICIMPRGDQYKVANNLVQNNLLLRNYTAAATFIGCDLIVYMGQDAGGKRTVLTNHSQSNLYATGLGMPTLRPDWNTNVTLADWQQKFGEGKGSRAMPFLFEISGDMFKITDPQAEVKRAIATPLPPGLSWKPANPKLVGSSLTAWPIANL